MPSAATAAVPQGFLDVTNCTKIAGWACDADDYSRPLTIHFYLDGPAGTGAFVGAANANKNRPDVSGACGGTTAHGFDIPPNPILTDGKSHRVYAYALNVGPAANDSQLPNLVNSTSLACAYVPPSSSLKYFGFAGGADHIAEMTPFSNAVHLGVDSNVNYAAKLNAITAGGARAILGVNNLFFCKTTNTTPAGRNIWVLCADYAQRWGAFRSTHAPQLDASRILAFYLGEEPTWNGISANDLRIATDTLFAAYPGIPRMLVEAYPSVGQVVVPYNMSWVAFDQYGVRDPAADETYKARYATIKSRRSNPAQKMIVIGDAWWASGLHGANGIAMGAMGEVALNYYHFARADLDVVGLINFNWPTFPEGTGARDLPGSAKPTYSQIGRSIKGPVNTVWSHSGVFSAENPVLAGAPGGILYQAIVGTDRRPYFRRRAAFNTWKPWTAVSGITLGAAPAITATASQLLMLGVSAGSVSVNIQNRSTEVWGGWTSLGIQTPSAPALSNNGSMSVAAVRGADNRLWTFRAGSGEGWLRVISPITTSSSPGIAYFPAEGRWYLISRNINGRLDQVTATDGRSWANWVQHNAVSSLSAPSLYALGSELYLAAVGPGNTVWYTKKAANAGWAQWTQINGSTQTINAPGLAAFATEGKVFWSISEPGTGRVLLSQ